MFILASSDRVLEIQARISTSTNNKSVISEGWSVRPGNYTGGRWSNIWVNAPAVIWSSLGTINFPAGFTGRILITKISDASAGGGIPGPGQASPPKPVDMSHMNQLM